MEGLKYLLKEIEAKRHLLQQQKAPDEVELYISQHGKLPSEKLNSSKPPPNGYEVKEVLEYSPGTTALRILLGAPNLKNHARLLCLYVEQRRAEKPPIKYIKNGVEWTYPGGFKIADKELEKLLMASHPYARWEKDKRKAKPRLNPADNRNDVGGWAIGENATGQFFTIPIIVIDEDTFPRLSWTIWRQLLFCAWGYGYFNESGKAEAYEQLKRYYNEDVLGTLLVHFQKHTFSPYNAKSNMSYIKRLYSGYSQRLLPESINTGFPMYSTGDGKAVLSRAYFPLWPGSVLHTAQQTGVPEWTIWRLVRQGKIKAHEDQGCISLDDNAINEIKRLDDLKNKRKGMLGLAILKGKSKEAAKKWLQRHKGPPDEKLLKRWLKIT